LADVNKDLITVHGREALNLPYTRFKKNATGREEQVDISASDIFFEVPASNLRKKLIVDPADPMGLLIQLTRAEVATLLTTESDFALVDETVVNVPDVEWTGKIKRIGYVGAP
jgi:hypothetical protein